MKTVVNSKEYFEKYFYFDPTSPTGIRWKVFNRAILESNKRFHGDIAGFKKRVTGGEFMYYRVKLNGVNYAVHRIVWILNFGDIPDGYVINHKNCDTFDNNLSNLEICTQKENMRRRKDHVGVGLSRANTSGKTGVSLDVKIDRKSGKTNEYFKAFWTDLEGNHKSKGFKISEYGYDEAFRLASEYRDLAIQNL